jgi:ribosomal-protein-alanine N-acetyltransferase
LLGFLVARNVGPEWELENIAVAFQAQRHGIGTQLLHGFLAETDRAGNPVVFLEVRESNTAARALYEKSGFSQVGRRSAYYHHPAEDAVLYRWTAPQPFSE